MSEQKSLFITSLVIGLLFALNYSGYLAGREQLQREAISAGCAEWVPGDDGRPEFRWKAPVEGKP